MYKNKKDYVITGNEVVEAISKNTHRELEEGILGGLLLGEIAKGYLIRLSPDIFYYEQHKEILKAMIELNTASKPIDVITVGGYLKNINKLEFVGGHYYLAQLSTRVSGASFLDTAILQLYELALNREAITKTEILQAKFLEPAADPLELLQEFQSELELLLTKALKGNLLTTDGFISNVDTFLKRTKTTSVEVGLDVYDRVFPNGILWGSLNIIAARSGVGKTSLLTAMMMEALRQFPCLLVSYEMPESQMHYRMLRYHSNCELRGANADDPIYLQEAHSFNSYLKSLQPFNFIGPERPLDSNELLSVIKTKANQGVRFVFIDYLTMIKIDGNEDFRLRIGSFLRELKQLATRHSICIFLLSQLNRESTKGNNPRPQLSNLSESAAVEANADTVLLIYRPEYHGIHQWPEDAHPAVAGQSTQGQCELIAAKSRHQKGCSTVANCDLATNRFWPVQGGYTTYTQVEIAPF